MELKLDLKNQEKYSYIEKPLKFLGFFFVLFCFFLLGIVIACKPIVVLALSLAIIIFIILVSHPLLVSLAYVFTLPFGDFLNIPVTQDGFRTSTAILLTAFLFWMVKGLILKDPELFIAPLTKITHVLVLLLLSVVAISIVNTSNFRIAWVELLRFIYCVMSYFLIVFTIKDKKSLDLFVICVLLSGFIVAFIGLLEGIAGANVYRFFHNKSLLGSTVPSGALHTQAHRICGPEGDADFHSFHMVVVFIFSFYSFYVQESKFLKFLLLALMGLCVFNIIGSGARVSVLNFLVSLSVLWVFLEIPKKWITLISVTLAFVMFFFIVKVVSPELVVDRLVGSNVGRSGKSAVMRLDHIMMGMHMFLKHPIIGYGPYGFIIEYHRYVRFSVSGTRAPHPATNVFLELLTGYGIVGCTIFASILVSLFKSILHLKNTLNDKYKILAIAMFAWLSGYCFYIMFTSVVKNQVPWLFIAFLVAICSVHEKENQYK